jgi:hypothetical protein
MIIKQYRSLGTTLLALFTAITIVGCAVGQLSSIPPDRPQPVSSFSVEFVPAGAERYPPTDVKEVRPFENVVHYPGTSDETRLFGSPTRPYIKIGELRFGEAWYSSSNIRELSNMHVPRVGGDAVLVQNFYQTAAAMMKDPDSGNFINLYRASIVQEVIRYTDR